MKPKRCLRMRRAAAPWIIFFLLLFSCATPQQTHQESTQSLIDLGTFVIKPPSGKDWKMEIKKDKGFVKFANDKASLFFMTIMVREFTIDTINSRIENEVADKIRGDFEQILKERETAEKYDLKSVEKDVMTVKEKRYYTLFYKKWLGGFWGKATEYGKIFLYIPPDYERSYKYYGFVFDPAISYSTAKRVYWKNFSWRPLAASIKDDLIQEAVARMYELSGKVKERANGKYGVGYGYFWVAHNAMLAYLNTWKRQERWRVFGDIEDEGFISKIYKFNKERVFQWPDIISGDYPGHSYGHRG